MLASKRCRSFFFLSLSLSLFLRSDMLHQCITYYMVHTWLNLGWHTNESHHHLKAASLTLMFTKKKYGQIDCRLASMLAILLLSISNDNFCFLCYSIELLFLQWYKWYHFTHRWKSNYLTFGHKFYLNCFQIKATNVMDKCGNICLRHSLSLSLSLSPSYSISLRLRSIGMVWFNRHRTKNNVYLKHSIKYFGSSRRHFLYLELRCYSPS